MDDFVLTPVSIMDFLKSDKDMNVWTGINSVALMKSFADTIVLYYPEQIYTHKLNLIDRLDLFFIKLKPRLKPY